MCSNCNVTYYGKTFLYFYTRAAEHMGISNLTGKHLKNVKQSALSDHLLQCKCTINFDHFDILAAASNKFKLLLRESSLIKREKPILNRTMKSFPLEMFDWDDSSISVILLSHDCQLFFLIASNDFNVCTDRAVICFNMSS